MPSTTQTSGLVGGGVAGMALGAGAMMIAGKAGVEIGTTIGAAGGPAGMIVGAVVGGLIGAGIGYWLGS